MLCVFLKFFFTSIGRIFKNNCKFLTALNIGKMTTDKLGVSSIYLFFIHHPTGLKTGYWFGT